LHLDSSHLKDRDRALTIEWLLADGAGGYASSTVLLCGTRRYHGLWVPALKPPVDRRVVLSHIDERLAAGGCEKYLSTTEYGGGFYPDGSPYADRFDLEPLPRLTSRAGRLTVEREVLLLRDGAGVCLTYRVRGDGAWALDLAPMLAVRPIHHLGHRHEGFRVEAVAAPAMDERGGSGAPPRGAPALRCLSPGAPSVYLWTDVDAAVAVNPLWYYGVFRRVERDRGFDHFEDLLAPGRWTFRGSGPAEWHVFCSFDPPRPVDVEAARHAHLARQVELAVYAGSPRDHRIARLVRAADAFLVRRRLGGEDLATVIAGYHWFGDWGRDTMIALPGLAMETGRLEVAEKVLRAFAAAASEGMIPNCFAEETGLPQYNTVDASLWFLQAVAAYLQAGGDEAFVRQFLWGPACEICEYYARGTRFGISCGPDHLVTAGSPDTQLTWMDAKVRGRPVTPRYGKAVEICALWISGLGLMRQVAGRLHLGCPAPPAAVEDARRAFEEVFWNPAAGCLYDCVLPDGRKDASVRPNQILAVGLPHAPLAPAAAQTPPSGQPAQMSASVLQAQPGAPVPYGQRPTRQEMAKAVVRKVRERLLTPRGLRTLAPDDPAYRGRYIGGPDDRDAAYHQGTAWPWLLAPYVDAVFAVESKECARAEAGQVLAGLLDSMEEAGLGFIGEVYDGDPPHRPGGCIAQAWSVAAAIHIWKRLEAAGGAA
jgi:predicted glycogen debranching enzyme